MKLMSLCFILDSVTERDVILEKVYPELREYCRHRHGVEFQVNH